MIDGIKITWSQIVFAKGNCVSKNQIKSDFGDIFVLVASPDLIVLCLMLVPYAYVNDKRRSPKSDTCH